jgi:Coenzyme PQQ synthesis protein D (PqqD)
LLKIKKSKNKKPLIPTEKEFLKYTPRRVDLEWKVNSEGLVEIKIPKFKSNFGKSFCRIIKKDNYFIGNMDKLGSLIWQNCDGLNAVKNILEIVKKEFPDEKNIDQRLYLFIQQLHSLRYLDL